MLTYVSIYSVLSTIALNVNSRRSGPWVLLILAFLLWFMGARYYVGCDFTGYLNRFNYLDFEMNLTSILASEELGFSLFMGSVKALGLDYMWVNLFASAIILFGFYYFLKAFQFPLIILTLLFPIIIIQLSMSGIRQGIAVALLMGAAGSFMKGQRLSVAIWILIASTFHTSAIIYLPISGVAGRHVTSKRLVMAAIILLPVVYFVGEERAGTYQDRYIDQIYGAVSSGGGIIRYGMSLLPAIFLLRYNSKFKMSFAREYELLRLFAIIIICMAPIALVSTLALHRLVYYVMPFSIVMFVYLSVFLAPIEARLRNSLKVFSIFFYGGYMVSWLLTSRHADLCYTPYQNYLTI